MGVARLCTGCHRYLVKVNFSMWEDLVWCSDFDLRGKTSSGLRIQVVLLHPLQKDISCHSWCIPSCKPALSPPGGETKYKMLPSLKNVVAVTLCSRAQLYHLSRWKQPFLDTIGSSCLEIIVIVARWSAISRYP